MSDNAEIIPNNPLAKNCVIPACAGMTCSWIIRDNFQLIRIGRRVVAPDICKMKIADLLIMKRRANRPKDRLDIDALEKILRGEDPNA